MTKFYERLEKGVCGCCGARPPKPEKTVCQRCQDNSNRSQVRIRQRRRDEGLCWYCGKDKPYEGFTKCLFCVQLSKENKRKHEPRRKELYKALKERVFDHYGRECQCCGFNEDLIFLSIDHIYNDGAKHRKEIGSLNIYKWLTQNDYPEGFQTLCHNCNFAKALNGGTCPHITKRKLELVS